jgi:RNA polymerase sigma-70 factor (family 1)
MDRFRSATEMNSPRFTDAELMAGIVNSDRNAFRELYDRYQEEMYRVALRKTHSEEVAEEIVQDVFVGLWEKRSKLVIEEVRYYLFRSVKNAVLDHVRAQLVRQNYAHEYVALHDPAANQTEDVLALYELMSAIYKGMDNLSEKTREIFRFNRLESLSIEEISQLLNMPRRTVEYHITVALRAMRISLRDYLPIWVVLLIQ